MERENFLSLADNVQREKDLKWLYAYPGSNYKLILHGKSPDMALLAEGIASAIEKSWGHRPEINEIPESPDNGFFKTLVRLAWEDYGTKCLYIATDKMLRSIEEIIGRNCFEYWDFSENPFTGSIIDCFEPPMGRKIHNVHNAYDKIGVVSYTSLRVEAKDLTTLLHAAYWYQILGKKMSIYPEIYCQTAENEKEIERFLKKLGVRRCNFNYPTDKTPEQNLLYIRPAYFNPAAIDCDEYVVPCHMPASSLFRKIFHSWFLKSDMKKILSEHQNVLN